MRFILVSRAQDTGMTDLAHLERGAIQAQTAEIGLIPDTFLGIESWSG
jgi:hypothetical protein